MSAGKLKLLVEQGATFRRNFRWQTGDTPTDVDLTGYTARMMIRRTDDEEAAPLVSLTTENGGIEFTTPAEGRMAIFISATATAAMPAVDAAYDLEMVNGAEVVRLLQGAVDISPEVTK